MHLPLETILAFCLTAIVSLIGAVEDLRTRRIPNRLTFPAMAILLLVHGLFSGLPGLREAGLGLLGGLIIFLIPYAFGALGAGDVKLMAAIGAGLGGSAVVTLILFTSLAGGIQIAVWMLWQRLGGGKTIKGWRLCYGPAIAAGTLGAMGLILAGQPYLHLTLPRF